jgi:hypothetical protein
MTKYKTWLLKQQAAKVLEFDDLSGADNADYMVSFTDDEPDNAANDHISVLTKLKLVDVIHTSNMVCLVPLSDTSSECDIKKFDSIPLLLTAYCTARLQGFETQRLGEIERMRQELQRLSFKAHFIQCVLDGRIGGKGLNRLQWTEQIYQHIPELVDHNAITEQASRSGNVDFLLSMPMSSMTTDHIMDLESQLARLRSQIDAKTKSSASALWLEALQSFAVKYAQWLRHLDEQAKSKPAVITTKTRAKRAKV